ncbi:MAG: hypothetical protein V5A33_00210 [Halobacteriales archaeon]
MSERTRRTVLTLGVGLLGATAGCLGADGTGESPTEDPTSTGTDSPPSVGASPTDTPPDGGVSAPTLSFDHARPLSRVDAGFPQRDVGAYYLGLVASADHATAFPSELFDDDSAAAFLDGTDFDRAAVVVLQDRKGSSHPDLEATGVSVTDGTAAVEARYPGNERTSDVTPNTLLVRMPAEDPPSAARSVVQPQHGDADRFATPTAYDGVPAFDAPGDLVVRNRDCASASMTVTVTRGGDLFYRGTADLYPASARRVTELVSRPGEWRVVADRGDETGESVWSLPEGPPGDLLVDVAGDGSLTLSRVPEGVTDAPDACETDGLPYESSNPEENLADPVDLWVVDRAEDGSVLSVTVRDGDAVVWSGEFDTREGYDKARRTGLLAKKTTYEVEVTADDGRAATRSVMVTDGVGKLLVRVTESGELAVDVE